MSTRDARQEFGDSRQFRWRIVEAGNHQRHDFQPETHGVNAPDGVQNRGEASAQFMIVAVVETFQIHLVEVHPGPQIFEHLGGGVAVGDESGGEAHGARLAENRYGPLGGDERLVVRTDNAASAGRQRGFHDAVGRNAREIERGAEIAQGLRGDPVLAVSAMQVAAQHAEAERAGAGQRVKERLLLDGIELQRAYVAIGDVELACAVVAHLADARESGGDGTAMAAGVTTDAAGIQFFVEFSFADLRGELFSHGLHIRPSTA